MDDRFSRREALKAVISAGALAIVEPASAIVADAPLTIGSTPVEVVVRTVTAHTVRITVQPLNSDAAPLNSDAALLDRDWGAPIAQLRSSASPRSLTSGNLRVSVVDKPLTIRVEQSSGNLVQQVSIADSFAEMSFSIHGGLLLGLGQGGSQFDRRGQVDAMTSGQGGYELGTHGARVPIQFLIGTAGWGMFIHAPLGQFDLRGEQGHLRAFEPGSTLDVFIIGASTPTDILSEYGAITGLPEMPPLWSLGYQQSHRTLDSPEAILAEAQKFREKRLPCDAMIYLGTGFCPNGWNTDNGEFTWNPRAFPDPPKAIETLHRGHFKVALHIVLEGQRLTGSVHDPCTAAPLPSGRTADGRWPPDRQVSCYWPFHKPLADLGVDGWWPDQGDGLDAPARLARIRMYFEGQQMYRPNQRVYALHRNGYAGMQRYAAFLWSGDVLSKWETLKTHVSVGINAGLSGIPFWGTDTGGFIPTQEYTGELFARWFQFAAFCPLFRSHGRDWKLHLPWGWNTGEIGYPETPSYHPSPEEIRNPAIEPICKTYLELRYRLMPYIYSAAKETCETGMPMIRALWLHHPDDPLAVARGDEYLFGRDLLVAPVAEQGASSRSLYLPQGTWYDFWTNEKLQGGRDLIRPVDLGTIPLYVRAGAVLPMGPVKQYTSEPVDEPLTLTIFPGTDGSGSLYEDDGETFSFRSGQYMRLQMSWQNAEHKLSIALAPGARMLRPSPLELQVKIAGSENTKPIAFKGDPVTIVL